MTHASPSPFANPIQYITINQHGQREISSIKTPNIRASYEPVIAALCSPWGRPQS